MDVFLETHARGQAVAVGPNAMLDTGTQEIRNCLGADSSVRGSRGEVVAERICPCVDRVVRFQWVSLVATSWWPAPLSLPLLSVRQADSPHSLWTAVILTLES